MYYKGANMLHTLRQIINDDDKWREILRGLNSEFYHQQVTTKQVEDYISEKANLDLEGFFDQYLRTIKIPVLEYKIKKNKVCFKFTNTVDNFNIPVKVKINNENVWLNVSTKTNSQKITENIKSFKVDKNFYFKSKESK
jgi:aminopeptidase N